MTQIKAIERIAEQDGLLHVHLFEVNSLTQVLTQTSTRIFRNQAGWNLLILTGILPVNGPSILKAITDDLKQSLFQERQAPVGPSPHGMHANGSVPGHLSLAPFLEDFQRGEDLVR